MDDPKQTARTYLIWSHEHGAWWGPDECGYVQALSKAGRYTHADALRICARSLPGTSRDLRAFPELPVREGDILMVRDRFVGQFPSEAEVLGCDTAPKQTAKPGTIEDARRLAPEAFRAALEKYPDDVEGALTFFVYAIGLGIGKPVEDDMALAYEIVKGHEGMFGSFT